MSVGLFLAIAQGWSCGSRTLTTCSAPFDSFGVGSLGVTPSFSVDNGSFDDKGSIYLFDGLDACIGLHELKNHTARYYPYDMHSLTVLAPAMVGTFPVPDRAAVLEDYHVKDAPDPKPNGGSAISGTVTMTEIVSGVRMSGSIDVVMSDLQEPPHTTHVQGKFTSYFCTENLPYNQPSCTNPAR